MVERHLRSTLLRDFRDTVLELGGDPDRILEKVGLTPQDVEKPELLTRSNVFVRLLNVAAAETGSDFFGLYLSTHLDLSFLGTLGLLIQHANTVGDALKTFIRYYPTRYSWASPELKVEGELAYLYSHNMTISEFMKQTFYLGSGLGLTMMRALLGEDWKPLKMHYPLDAPELSEHLYDLFQLRVEEGRGRHQMIFKASDLKRKVSHSFGQFGNHLQAQLDEMEKQLETDIVSRTEYLIRILLPEGNCSFENVSSLLSLGEKSLQRRLKAQGSGGLLQAAG